MIEGAVACSDHLLSPRFGQARNADGQEIPLVVLAMGKLGGRETKEAQVAATLPVSEDEE